MRNAALCALTLVVVAEPVDRLQRVALSTGVTVEYYEQGTSEEAAAVPVILIHGWPDSVDSFDLLRPLLNARLRVFTVGLRGFGGSDKPPGNYSIIQWAADIRSFLAAKSIRQAAVVGPLYGKHRGTCACGKLAASRALSSAN